MANVTLDAKLLLRNDTAANFTSQNPVLSKGECGFENNTQKFKIGDGITAWNSLGYVTSDKMNILSAAPSAAGQFLVSKLNDKSNIEVLKVSGNAVTLGGSVFASTPNAYTVATETAVVAKIHDLMNAASAMVFAGTVNGNGVIQSHNSDVITQAITDGTTNISELTGYRAGWLFLVTSAGTITGIGVVEVGDTVLCVSSYVTAYAASDWTVIQANIDVFSGATASIAGTRGMVPQPLAGDQAKVLLGSGGFGQATAASIADNAITTVKINNSAITTTKINDSAVTDAKIASCNVSKLQITTGDTLILNGGSA